MLLTQVNGLTAALGRSFFNIFTPNSGQVYLFGENQFDHGKVQFCSHLAGFH